MRPSAEAIDAVLPQTQCRRCGFSGCRPYAEALSAGEALINRCPPGGALGVQRLAALLNTEPLPLDPECGAEGPRAVARIEAEHCIGCTKCIQACPVDAIIGASKRMHTVIAELCTGCELCVPPCPVDCILIEPLEPQPVPVWNPADTHAARQRHQARAERLIRVAVQRDQRLTARATTKLETLHTEPADSETARKRIVIEAALARARERAAARASSAGQAVAASEQRSNRVERES
jgi:electron transport complex protein RnfB